MAGAVCSHVQFLLISIVVFVPFSFFLFLFNIFWLLCEYVMENLKKIIPDIRENLEEGLWISIVPMILYLSFSIGKVCPEVLVDDRTSMANFSVDYCGYCCVEAQVKILGNRFSPVF